MDKLAVIIVAGGSGSRMRSDTPKQFMIVNNRPMIMDTLDAFSDAFQRILVLPKEWIDRWQCLCMEYNFVLFHDVVEGGTERFYSVLNGLSAVSSEVDYVAVHDGVRPFVTPVVIANTLQKAKEFGAAVPVIGVTDSIRMLDEIGESKPLKRSLLMAVQTPQIFRVDILRIAYRQPFANVFTDDASVVESAGYKVALSEGDTSNIKVTYKNDI